jgi:hypothetical protein
MSSRSMLLLLVVLAWPFLWLLFVVIDVGPGLVWIGLHQLYYAPMSWIGEPLFSPSGDVGFLVRWPGRLLTAGVYGAAFVATWINARERARRRSGNLGAPE